MAESDLIDHFDLAFYATQNTFEDDFLIDCLMSENDFSIDDIDVDLFTPTTPPTPPPLDDIDIDQLLSTPDLTDLSADFIRSLPDNDLAYYDGIQGDIDTCQTSDFGHLIAAESIDQTNGNHCVENQFDALFFDQPLFVDLVPTDEEPEEEEEEQRMNQRFQCLWQDCYVTCHSQTSLVQHIEKMHVEVKKGDQFTCFWFDCPRKVKPFNARYKLLIHMRVHSGEKPNKCQFEGCNKAFSRLENLKIHQRSHTGERPYLCQFPTCTKSFSNSSDRAKHQRTHFDTKPYACQVLGCTKKYTDPSSLRKHVKNHTADEQMLIKKKSDDDVFYAKQARKYFDPQKQKAVKTMTHHQQCQAKSHYEHDYYNNEAHRKRNVKQDLKNKISRRMNNSHRY